MTFSFNQSDNLSFSPVIPAVLERYLLPFGRLLPMSSDEPMPILLQERRLRSCQFHYAVYRLTEAADLHIRNQSDFLYFYLALQQDHRLAVSGLPPVYLQEGQFNLFYSPRFNLQCEYEGGGDAITLMMHYNTEELSAWAADFPPLVPFLKKVHAGQPARLFDANRWINRPIQEALFQVTHTAPETPGYASYSDLMTRTLLYHLLVPGLKKPLPSPFTHFEFNSLHAARDLIRKDLRSHITIRNIASQVGVNEFKLKNGFRELFGNGLYEFLRAERMQQALHLFDDPHISIKEIAAITGYKSVPGFIKAFRKQFGRPPGEYRKKQ